MDWEVIHFKWFIPGDRAQGRCSGCHRPTPAHKTCGTNSTHRKGVIYGTWCAFALFRTARWQPASADVVRSTSLALDSDLFGGVRTRARLVDYELPTRERSDDPKNAERHIPCGSREHRDGAGSGDGHSDESESINCPSGGGTRYPPIRARAGQQSGDQQQHVHATNR